MNECMHLPCIQTSTINKPVRSPHFSSQRKIKTTLTTIIMHSSTIFQFCFLLQLVAIALCATQQCHPEDQKALLQIKKDLNNPTALSSWKTTADCCRHWKGVSCDRGKTHRVNFLNLDNIDMKPGHPLSIPPSIATLPYLNTIQLGPANFTGPIPRSLLNLTNLKDLSITSTLLSGTIPEFLSQITTLTDLSLSFNNLSGEIPASLSRLSHLQSLDLQSNSLSGPIPDIFNSFPNFSFLWLSSNQLSGKIPKSMGNINVTYLYLDNNKLEGDASMLFGSKKDTWTINLARNKLAFDLGKVEFSNNLQILDLSHNEIYGNIPQQLTTVRDLTSMDLSYNNLCGKIPGGGALSNIVASAYAHNKCLCGSPLPSCTRRRSF
ncbi:polygalacturonase inhibitor 2 [Arachis duranensis]|uniref:Polygalacturonase inhibitor 2 n=1 Tax=Arachis duranensis TaxID=130453 RepID=A0A6P4CUF0_ARADU|nr:polygalacturonase inhibitor 2 [Arachis duranensis]